MWKRIYNSLLGLSVFLLSGIVVVETPDSLRVGEQAYQWLWLARMGILFSAFVLLVGMLTREGDRDVWKGVYPKVVWSMIVYGGVEAVWGLGQLHGFLPSNHSLYRLIGSFFNPGPYSGYLAMVFPLCLNEWLSLKDKKGRSLPEHAGYYLSAGVLLLMLCVLPAGMSRSAWVAAAVSGAWVCSRHYSWGVRWSVAWQRYRKRMIGVTTLLLVGLLLVGGVLFHVKKDSASGRLFMWKMSCRAIAQLPTGYGAGKFAYAYGNAQEAYFAGGGYSRQEERVAGSPEYAFNEYLQVGVEHGVVVLLVLLVGIGCCLWQGAKQGRVAACGGAIAWLVFAFSSYPMQIPALAGSFALLLAACVAGSSRRGWMAFALCVGGVSVHFYSNNAFEACKEWADARMSYNIGDYGTAKEAYEKLYPSLKNRGSFLFEYGHTLHKLEEYDASTRLLEEAMCYSCDPMILNIIGKNYRGKKEYERAEEYLIRSTHRLPGRIYPYYLLAGLYEEWGKREEMRAMAKIVMTKEPKVNSVAIREMRDEVRKMLK